MNGTISIGVVHTVHSRVLYRWFDSRLTQEGLMPRRGHSTTIGKFAKLYQNRRASEIRVLGEMLRREQGTQLNQGQEARSAREGVEAR